MFCTEVNMKTTLTIVCENSVGNVDLWSGRWSYKQTTKLKGSKAKWVMSKSARKFIKFNRNRSTAAPCATWAASAPIFRGDGKTILHKVDDPIIGKTRHLGIEKHVDIIYLLLRVIIIWLIQSQSQRGPASAKAGHYHTQRLPRILLQDVLQFIFCFIGNCEHSTAPFLNCTLARMNNLATRKRHSINLWNTWEIYVWPICRILYIFATV